MEGCSGILEYKLCVFFEEYVDEENGIYESEGCECRLRFPCQFNYESPAFTRVGSLHTGYSV